MTTRARVPTLPPIPDDGVAELHEPAAPRPQGTPTIWGQTPVEVHERFWAAFGVQAIRRGESAPILRDAELYMLVEPETLIIMPLAPVLDVLSWLGPHLLLVRLRGKGAKEYREVVVTDPVDGAVKIRRHYADAERGLTRFAVTTRPELAELWANAAERKTARHRLREAVGRERRAPLVVRGAAFDGSDDRDTMRFVNQLIETWDEPGATIPRAREHAPGVWVDSKALIPETTEFLGRVWVGAGRTLGEEICVAGPAVVWDDPRDQPISEEIVFGEIDPSRRPTGNLKAARTGVSPVPGKRVFDIVFSLMVLLLTAPLFPLVALLIFLEDGWPIFFTHERETLGGREFPCLKFRSMRNDADSIKAELEAQNEADGPQFFIDPDHDPRVTRVGRFIRKWQIDELPQFLNVLVGHMSVVGPRPSPFKENQYCPGWREGRLSTRPGVTGLWQVRRTRAPGQDFQEWVKYDLRYVERRSWALDLWIIWRTLAVVMPRFRIRMTNALGPDRVPGPDMRDGKTDTGLR